MTRARRLLPVLGLVPFTLFALVFMIEPTLEVVVGAFQRRDGAFTVENITGLFEPGIWDSTKNSLVLSVTSALIGGALGAVLCGVLVAWPPASGVRRVAVAASSVLAQFGGFTLAFMFISLFGLQGIVTTLFSSAFGLDIYGTGWLYTLPGLIVVYLYFQIPMMVLVFLPACEGLRAQWREAAESLGATRRQYFVQVAVPIVRPAFLGSLLLLFANAFAAYATAAVLVGQGQLVLPLVVRNTFASEVMLGREHLGYAVALEMVVVVSVVMGLYAWLLRRTTRWLG